MTTQLSYVIGGDICIHQPGNTGFLTLWLVMLPSMPALFAAFERNLPNLFLPKGAFLIPHGIFWLSFVIDSEEKRCFGVFHWIWSTLH
jgi:hypothetical protein